jgi:Zn-finger nucleic acid-binding protein
VPPQPAGYPAPPPRPYSYDDDEWDERYGKKKYKKKSILGEIFDF